MVRDHNVNFLAIQETKLEVISDKLCYSLWGSEDCNWVFVPAQGANGGMLSLWSKSNANLIFSFSGEGFLGVCIDWGVRELRCYIVNVYSKCDLASKKILWSNLIMSKGGFGAGNWCVVGDFNAVMEPGERKWVNVETALSSEMKAFSDFLGEMHMVDLPCLGRRFTWYHASGRAMSRLDRIFVSMEWIESFANVVLWVLARDVSDHCPLVLKIVNYDWGPKPFRFNYHWLEHKQFQEVVKGAWESCEATGWMGFILKEKLKRLKLCLKDWSKVEFGSVDTRLKKIIDDIQVLDIRGETFGLVSEEVTQRKELFSELWKLQKSKEAIIFQRSRSKWLRQGDANSKYFHGCIAARKKRNSISALKVGDIWLESP
jgi:hypothetical protein